ncbi:MAG: stage III sporulation protein AF [Lachnospiraceae bacterium]|nr:stage III sporulation protein AF [Lachnospiraceae bacterium]
MEGLLSKIGQMAIFMICARTLLHFRAKESYEKYLKLLVSLMLLVLLVEPLMDFFGKGEEGEFLQRIQSYSYQLQDILENEQLNNEEISEILSHMTMGVSEQVQTVDNVEVEIEDGKVAEDHGEY